MKKTEFLILTGLSGAGKSVALKTLEDLGYYTVDNLPIELLESFVGLEEKGNRGAGRAAMVMDSRAREIFSRMPGALESLRSWGHKVTVVCLVASREVLQKRFSETRRVHPLDANMPLGEAISREAELMQGILEMSDLVLDTSDLSPHELKTIIRDRFGSLGGESGMLVTLVSFGYKFGIPKEADLVFDVRFLPNPYFVDKLREKNGRDPEVVDYIQRAPDSEDFIIRLCDFVEGLLPRYIREGRGYLTVAVGCTGGRHRSVAVLSRLADRLGKDKLVNLQIRHREIKED